MIYLNILPFNDSFLSYWSNDTLLIYVFMSNGCWQNQVIWLIGWRRTCSWIIKQRETHCTSCLISIERSLNVNSVNWITFILCLGSSCVYQWVALKNLDLVIAGELYKIQAQTKYEWIYTHPYVITCTWASCVFIVHILCVSILTTLLLSGIVVYTPSQWGTTLYCNIVSQRLGAHTKWSLV